MNSSKSQNIVFWKISNIANIELIKGTTVSSTCGRHFHDGYIFGTIEGGERRFIKQGRNDVLEAGDVFALNPGEVHECWNRETSYHVLCMDEAVMKELSGRNLGITPRIVFPELMIRDPLVFRHLLELCHSVEQPESLLETESRLVQALACLAGRHAEFDRFQDNIGRTNPAVSRAREYLEEHYAGHICVDDLAENSGISAYHLIRSFNREYGLPPHAYQLQLRVKEARSMLWKGQSLSEVAYNTGFSDQAHFTRLFKKLPA